MAEPKMVIPLPADWQVLTAQRDALLAALVKVLDAHEAEAKAYGSYQVALDNYGASHSHREGMRHTEAMTDASNAEREARLLLLTLRNGHRGQEAKDLALWAARGRWLTEKLSERTTPDGRTVLELVDEPIWAQADGTFADYCAAVDAAMEADDGWAAT